jgi:hypothetical protein
VKSPSPDIFGFDLDKAYTVALGSHHSNPKNYTLIENIYFLI